MAGIAEDPPDSDTNSQGSQEPQPRRRKLPRSLTAIKNLRDMVDRLATKDKTESVRRLCMIKCLKMDRQIVVLDHLRPKSNNSGKKKSKSIWDKLPRRDELEEIIKTLNQMKKDAREQLNGDTDENVLKNMEERRGKVKQKIYEAKRKVAEDSKNVAELEETFLEIINEEKNGEGEDPGQQKERQARVTRKLKEKYCEEFPEIMDEGDLDDTAVPRYSDEYAKALLTKIGDEDVRSDVHYCHFAGVSTDLVPMTKYVCVPSSEILWVWRIWKTYPDVFSDRKFSEAVCWIPFSLLCCTLREMDATPVEDLTKSLLLKWSGPIKESLRMGLKVDFALEHLKRLARVFLGTLAQQHANLEANNNSEMRKFIQARKVAEGKTASFGLVL